MALHEDTYLNRIPYTITHALKGDLDPSDRWKELLMAVESSHDDGPPLDPDLKSLLELCHLRRESPTEKLLSELGCKGYKVFHLRKWLRAQGLIRAAELLEGGDRMTGRQRSQSASSTSGIHKPQPEYHHSHSAVERVAGRPIQLPSNYRTMYGSHAGGGGTVELEGDVLTGFGSTIQREMGASKSESASAVEKPNELRDASAVDVMKSASLSRVKLLDPVSEHATFRMRTEEGQPGAHSPLPSEDHTPFVGEGGPYHQHHLVGSETVRHPETTASSGDSGSSPKEEATHVQVIKKQAKEFLSEMDAKAIARALHVLALIPEPVKNSILQSMSTQDANAELLTFLKGQASEDQMKAIFKFASEQTDLGRMSEFAADVLQKLQQGGSVVQD